MDLPSVSDQLVSASMIRKRLPRSVRFAIVALTGWAVVQELRTPADRRQWHGRVAGIVPYDFRVPSVDRMRSSWWDPNGPLITPQVMGVGWTLNFGRLAEAIKAARSGS
jgi:hypothetical protein